MLSRIAYDERTKPLNANSIRDGKYVLYWMQASQRIGFNHALVYAVRLANDLRRSLVVYFGLTERFPEANLRHYKFMLEGLRDVERRLSELDAEFIVRRVDPDVGAVDLSRDACAVVVDRGYLRIQKSWRSSAAKRMRCPLFQVETDAVVPVEVCSGKEEYSAATIRRKITPHIERFMAEPPALELKHRLREAPVESMQVSDVPKLLRVLKVDRSVPAVNEPEGGEDQALKALTRFLKRGLDDYPQSRNDPNLDAQSGLSPYLHFGHISPVQVALEVRRSGSPGAGAFFEELIVRRELSINFVHHNPSYDSYGCLPDWAKRSLGKHARDKRHYVYLLEALESADTHDEYWNAAQKQMLMTGKMHGYMRMYWGKKILEWTRHPEEAYRAALYLNNKYELDGRDPNGFAGVAWCFGKHDRPWGERKVFGTVRYMSSDGLNRKFDADAYAKRWR